MNISLSQILEEMIKWSYTKGIKLVIGVVALIIGWKLLNKFNRFMVGIVEKKNTDKTLNSFVGAIINIAAKSLLIVVIMGYMGFETASLAAVIASAGVTLGLSLQGSLSNLAGGVIILMIRPFNIGDYIDAAGFSGTVEKIGIFYTSIVTPDNKQIMIPNGTLANGSMVNYSSKELRRIDLSFSASYDADIKDVKQILMNVAGSNDKILKEPEPVVFVSQHGVNSIGYVVKVWCKNNDYWDIYYDLLERVKEAFDQSGVGIPYPQMDVHIKDS
jgi:small conductance mechanosensitive channel